jgi:hypothetical protein
MSSSTPDFKSLSRDDQIFLGAGLLAFIFSFIEFAHISFDGIGNTISAWHGVGVLAGLLLLLAVAAGAAVVFAPASLAALPIPGRLLATGLAALALVFFVVRWLTLPSANGFGIHVGYSLYWGGYVLLVLTIATVVSGFLGMKANGVALPGQSSPGEPPAPSV